MKFEKGDVVYCEETDEIGIIMSMWEELILETRTEEGYIVLHHGFYHSDWVIISKADFA